jgi:PIN domain nuclease of toxin-antitoxin system
MLNLDTHILVHALQGSLKPDEKRLLSSGTWSISAIVLWELAKLRQLGRVEIDVRSPEFARALGRIQVWPLDLAVCAQTMDLDFQSDPADEIIAATSIVHRVPLVTRDARIRCSAMVPFPSRA